MKNKITNALSNMSLKPKLRVAFLATVSIPVLMAAVFSLIYFSDFTSRTAHTNLLDKRHVASLLYEKKARELHNIGQTATSNNLVLLNLELLLYPPITDYLRSLRRNSNVDFISILDPEGRIIISSNKEYFVKPAAPILEPAIFDNIRMFGPATFSLKIENPEFLNIEGIGNGEAFCLVSVYPEFSYDQKLLGYAFLGILLQQTSREDKIIGLVDEIKSNVASPVLITLDGAPEAYSEGSTAEFAISLREEITAQRLRDDSFVNVIVNGEQYVFSFFPIPYKNNEKTAAVGVGFLETYFNEARNTAAVLLALITCAGFALAFGISFLLSQKISEPVILMAEGAKQIVEGNFEKRISVTSGDEIGVLASEFNYMTERLKQTLGNLKAEIEERRQTEVKLEKAQSYLKNVFNSMTSLLVSVNPDGEITAWNTAAEKKTGIPAARVLSKKVWDVLPFLARYRKNFNEVVEFRSPRQFSREVIEGTESQFLNISIFPLVSNGSDGAVFLVDDVTEIEKKELQLRQAQKMEMIGNLVGGLAHDFNNVLAAILGSTSLLKHHLHHEDLSIEYVDEEVAVIEESTKRAADMVNELLILSRKQEISFSAIDLNTIVRNVVKICHSSFDKSVEIRTSLPPGHAMIQADLTQIEQVLLNLCVNAAHSMTIMRKPEEKTGGVMTVDLRKFKTDRFFLETHPEAEKGEYWVVSVSDTGVGMDSNMLAKIFDPFFSTKQKYKGTGLGLSIAYNIIHQHGGFIDVYSERGMGSTFRMYIPLFKGEFAEKRKSDDEMVRGAGLVLVIDDEKYIRLQSKKILEKCGYQVLVAETPEEGIEIFRHRAAEIGVILLDLAMPKMSGQDVFAELKKTQPLPKVIIMSGFSNDDRIQELLLDGVVGVLQKPFSLKDLSEKIREVLGEPGRESGKP